MAKNSFKLSNPLGKFRCFLSLLLVKRLLLLFNSDLVLLFAYGSDLIFDASFYACV